MTEEAREAAYRLEAIDAADDWLGSHRVTESWRMVNRLRDQLVRSQGERAAGVREGIRQAREAVAGEDLFDNTGDDFDGAYKAAIDDALRVIDALEAEK